MPPQEEGRFRKFLLPILAILFFFRSVIVLAPWLAPRTTVKYADADAKKVKDRFPVILVTRTAPDSASPKLIVAHWGILKRVPDKLAEVSFLLRFGNSAFVDQDGDAASFTAQQISPGRQSVWLKSVANDYTYESEYEAEAKKVFPRRFTVIDRRAGVIYAILCFLVLLCAGYFLATRLLLRRPQSNAEDCAAPQR